MGVIAMLNGKTVVLGITGSIAAYKIANLASMLCKQHCNVHVIMTKNATEFIAPLTFETLTNNKCIVDTFDRRGDYDVEHISIAKQADLFVIAPASANIIGKIAHGIADDMLSTTVMACTCKKLISPAMNSNMYQNPIVQNNIEILKSFGYVLIEPAVGMLACKDIGIGKLPSEELIFAYIERELACQKDLKGKKVLVTAGATQEAIDPVRYITNHSSGKMGYAIAKAAMLRGADVTLITGKTFINPPEFIKVIEINSAAEMMQAVKQEFKQMDIIIKAAAVADYTPKNLSEHKLKKKDGELSLELTRTEDILAYIGANKEKSQFLCGFSMETENLIENSKQKLLRKNADMIIANSLSTEGAGFKVDTNVITMITKEDTLKLPIMSKQDAAHKILDQIIKLSN